MIKKVLILLGSISFGLGVIGIFLPVLPTTPFLLLSASLYAKSSERLHHWLINHRIFGEYIRNFQEDDSLPLHLKIISIGTMWVFMLFSIFFVVNETWYLQILLTVIGIGVSIYIFSFKTKKVNP